MRETVLFVDDEAALLGGLRDALRKEPFEILTANSASEALDRLERQRVDVVVSDEQMPGMSGSQFLAVVRRRFPKTIRIILSGQSSMQSVIRAINEGEIYRFLTKPCSSLQLAQTVRDALLLRGLARESARVLSASRRRRSALERLEQSDPGLTHVDRNEDGSINLECPDDIADLIRALKAEADEVVVAPSTRR